MRAGRLPCAGAALLLTLARAAQGRTVPTCVFDGKVFDGSNGEDLSSSCDSNGWSSFSVAFTMRLHPGNGYSRPVVFGPGSYESSDSDIDFTWAWLSSGNLCYSRTGSGVTVRAGWHQPNWAQPDWAEGRFLLTISSSGTLQIYRDGVLRTSGESSSGAFGVANRKVYVGMHSFKGSIEDMYIFDSVVGWESAVVPYFIPDCTFAGRVYADNGIDDFTSNCPATLGGALSVAVTLRLDSCCNTNPVVFKIEGSNRAVLYFSNSNTVHPGGGELLWKHEENGQEIMLRNVMIDTGETHRILVVIARSGYRQIFVDGALVAEMNSNMLWSTAARTLTLGDNRVRALVQDVFVFQEKVGWESAVTTSTTTTSTVSSSTLTTSSSSTTSVTSTSTTASSTSSSTKTGTSVTSTTSVTSATSSSTTSLTSTTTVTSTSSSSTSTLTGTSVSSTTSATFTTTSISSSTTSTSKSTSTTTVTSTTGTSTSSSSTSRSSTTSQTKSTTTSTTKTKTSTTTRTSTTRTSTTTRSSSTTSRSSTSSSSSTRSSSSTTRSSTLSSTSTSWTGTRTTTTKTSTRSATTTSRTVTGTTATSTVSTRTSTGTSTETSTATKTGTTTTEATLPPGVSSTTTTTDGAKAKSLAVSQAVGASVAALISEGNATSVTLETDLGAVTVVDLRSAVADVVAAAAAAAAEGKPVPRASFAAESGSKVSVPATALQALPQGALLTILPMAKKEKKENATDAEEADPFEGMGELGSAVMDISVYDEDGNHVPVVLEDPLLFRLPDATGGDCVFLDASGPGSAFWSSEGVWRASDAEVVTAGEEPGGVWCFTKHLSLFAAIFQVVLGCTNVELLSPKGVASLVKNEDWYRAESARIVFFVWTLLFICVLVGNLRDCWAHRLGSTVSAGKRINLCKSFMNWGPAMVKHKYAVVLVYLRDIHNCLRTGRAKLKSSSLTASVQRFLAVRTGIAVPCITQHCWNGADWLDSKASIPNTVLCSKLEFYSGYADRVILEDICARGPLGVLRRFVLTVLAMHPLLDAMRIGAGSMTVGKRTTLQVASICGVIATNALIFNFSGGLQSWESDLACPVSPTSQLFVVVASGVSVLVNAMPNSFLTDFGKQVDGRPFWTVVWWVWTLSYMLLAGLLIIVALANLNPKDRAKWYAALEWGMSIKLLGMPVAQSVRNLILLELFLREDRRCKPSQRFRVTMGLSHPSEMELTPQEKAEAETMARQAISAEELLNFMAILGDTVMPAFDPHRSTSEDVLHQAIEPLSMKPPALERYPVEIEVEEAFGLPKTEQLTCSVLHLDSLHGLERTCLSEQDSDPEPVRQVEGVRRCRWDFSSSTTGLEAEHALGFLLRAADDSGLAALAVLPLEEVVEGGGFCGSLQLHDFHDGSLKSLTMPSEASAVPLLTRSVQSFSRARLSVKVELAEGYVEALGRHAFRKLKSQKLKHQSEVGDVSTELQAKLAKMEAPLMFSSTVSAGPFCKARSYKKVDCQPPPETLVTHSRKGLFLHLVTAVLLDALGEDTTHEEVEELLVQRDFASLLDQMQLAGCEGRLYWIELFALSPRRGARGDWRESFLEVWPTVLRAMRRNAGEKKAADIRAGRVPRSPGPLRQLLVMDHDFSLMHEQGCLAELMLARAMRVRQRLLLHPDHLQGSSLGEELMCLSKELGRVNNSYCAAAYLENRQDVYDALVDLIVGGVKERREDEEATWQELGLDNVAATVAVVHVDFHHGDADGTRSRDFQMDDGGVDVDA